MTETSREATGTVAYGVCRQSGNRYLPRFVRLSHTKGENSPRFRRAIITPKMNAMTLLRVTIITTCGIKMEMKQRV